MASPTPSLQVFVAQLGRILQALLAGRAHAHIVIIVKDGTLSQVQINNTYLPGDLPKV